MANEDHSVQVDPRIHVDAAHLRALGAQTRGITLLPRQPARSVLNGRHGSRLRGRGLNFEELRAYANGDDTRTIDWKVTARTGQPHVRVYTEERDRPALLLVDQRQSMFYGTEVYMKSVVAAEAAAIVAHSVLAQGDRIGGVVFGDLGLAEVRPERSRKALNRFLSALGGANSALHASARPEATLPLSRVLQAAVRLAKNDALVIVISDFDGADTGCEAAIRHLAGQGDLILVQVADPTAYAVPIGDGLTVSDGALQAQLPGGTSSLGARLSELTEARMKPVRDWSRRYRAPLLPLTTSLPALDQVRQLMGHAPRRPM